MDVDLPLPPLIKVEPNKNPHLRKVISEDKSKIKNINFLYNLAPPYQRFGSTFSKGGKGGKGGQIINIS
jgi:hypothetical protein